MLTRAGWSVVLGAGALVLAGRLLGIFELYLLAAAAVALVVLSVASVQLTRLRLDVSRELHPPRVHAGHPSRVQLEVTNRSRRRTPLLALRDPVGDSRSARVLLAPLAAGRSVAAAYQLPTEHRGIVAIGPLRVEVTDPFGLAVLATEAAGVTELTVWPPVEAITPLPHTQGDEPLGGTQQRHRLRPTGQEFHALRPYVHGDDLRRVHWASTARMDELMVREDEVAWQGRATVLLDTRRGAYGGRSFESAVSAAASIVTAADERHFLVRFVTVDGLDTGFGSGRAHVDAILEQLAVVAPNDRGNLLGTIGALQRAGNGGAVAALLGGRSPAGVAAASRLATAFGHTSVVVFASGRQDLSTMPADVVVVDDATPFAEAWDRSLDGRSRPRRAAGALR